MPTIIAGTAPDGNDDDLARPQKSPPRTSTGWTMMMTVAGLPIHHHHILEKMMMDSGQPAVSPSSFLVLES